MPTRRVKYAFWLVGIVAALLIVWYLWMSKGTPNGQPALTSLTQNNIDQFKHDFDGSGDEARLVLSLKRRKQRKPGSIYPNRTAATRSGLKRDLLAISFPQKQHPHDDRRMGCDFVNVTRKAHPESEQVPRVRSIPRSR